MIVQRGELVCRERRKMTKANFNKLWSKTPKERDEFGTKRTKTITIKATKTTTVILNKK